MIATFMPSKAKGSVTAPPSKSMAHRYLICAALSEGESIIRNVSFSQDILATLDCLKALGAGVTIDEDEVHVIGISRENRKGTTRFDCRESGSTIRFFIPIAMMLCERAVFAGSERLLERPFSVYESISAGDGIEFIKDKTGIVVAGKLKSNDYSVPGDISSQFITGLLFALALIDSPSAIHITGKIESRSYLDLTVKALSDFGLSVAFEGSEISIKGGSLKNGTYVVEGDYSNAAFLDAFNLIGGDVKVNGLDDNSPQGDRIYREYYKQIQAAGKPCLDISDCPDLGPVLMAVMALNGGGLLTGTRRLKIKESDRGVAMARELEKTGLSVIVNEDSIEIGECIPEAPSDVLAGHNDHRIVMALSVLLSVTGGSISGVEAVNKSYPDFFDVIKNLNIKVEQNGMDQ